MIVLKRLVVVKKRKNVLLSLFCRDSVKNEPFINFLKKRIGFSTV